MPRALRQPFGAVQMGLIYVNPQGPDGNLDPMASAQRIRESFGLMAMNDEETAALIAGTHSVKRTVPPIPDSMWVQIRKRVTSSSRTKLAEQHGSGNAGDTITSGFEGAWTATPTDWSNGYL